jgi:hypothetical protein
MLTSQKHFFPFVLFLLAIVLSVLLRYTDSDYLPLVSSNSSSNVTTVSIPHNRNMDRLSWHFKTFMCFKSEWNYSKYMFSFRKYSVTDGPSRTTTFDFHCKSMERWVGIKHLVCSNGYNARIIFHNLQIKRSLACRGRVDI